MALVGWRLAPLCILSIWALSYILAPNNMGSNNAMLFVPMYAVLFIPYVLWLLRAVIRNARKVRSNQPVERDAQDKSARPSP